MGKIIAVLFGFAALVILGTAAGSFYTIDQGERGVITRFGAVQDTADPGLHFKTPWVESVYKFSTQTEIIKLDKVEAYSQDQQPATIRLSVNYSILPGQVSEVYGTFGSASGLEDRLVRPRVHQQLKNVFGHYTAQTAISQRDKLNADVKLALQDAVKGPVNIEGVQIEDIKFSPAYEQAVEARMTAEVEVQKTMQKAANEKVTAQITVTKAQAEADARLASARADAEATRIQGDAEAQAIRARGDALKDNPGLVALTQAERWDGKLPTTMVPGASVPFLGVK